jgi:hypothetical protein
LESDFMTTVCCFYLQKDDTKKRAAGHDGKIMLPFSFQHSKKSCTCARTLAGELLV